MNLQDELQKFLLKDIIIYKDKKKIKAGKVILFTIRDHYIYFTLKLNNNIKKFELPKPFKFRKNGDIIELNYTLEELGQNNPKKIQSIRNLTKKYFSSSNRYFDSILTLQTL